MLGDGKKNLRRLRSLLLLRRPEGTQDVSRAFQGPETIQPTIREAP